MNSSLPKLSLPDLNQLSISKSAHLPKKESFTDRLYKTKPAYVAKKFNNHEEVLGDSHRQIAAVALSQINEEKMNETEDLIEVESIDQTRESGEPYNIFKREGLSSSKYKEYQKPVYVNGQFVKHSIVGPQELYERHQRGLRRNMLKESALSSEKDSFSFSERSPSRLLKPLASMMTVEQSPSTRLLESQGSFAIRKITSVIKQKKESKDIKVNKEDLYRKLDQLRNSQINFYETLEQKHKNLPLGDQLHQTKEQRCLGKFEDATDYWEKLNYNINRKIKRGAGKSVMLRSDDFRQKIEEAQAFELAKTEGERYGTACWSMSLRNSSLKDQRSSLKNLKTHTEMESTRTSRAPSSLEVIRKCSRISKSSTNLPSLKDSMIYLDRTRKDYISTKNTDLQRALRKIEMKPTIDAEDFIVEGTNKLESEIQSLFKKIPYDKDGYVIPRDLFDKREPTEKPEYIVWNYQNSELLKNGLDAIHG